MNKTFGIYLTIIGLLLFSIGICTLIYNLDKINCEKNGGVYIWEFNSRGNKCHYKGDK